MQCLRNIRALMGLKQKDVKFCSCDNLQLFPETTVMFEALQTYKQDFTSTEFSSMKMSVSVAHPDPLKNQLIFFLYKSLNIFKEAIQSAWNVFQVMGTRSTSHFFFKHF